MATRTVQNGFDVWTITASDGQSRASFVPELGGVGSSLVLPGGRGPREILYRHRFFWDRHSDELRGGWPFLFPVCGRVEWEGSPGRYRANGCTLEMPIHGFAPRVPWEVAESAPDRLTLRLSDTDATRRHYPHAFAVELRYRMWPGKLVCEQRYTNRGAEPMPYYAGFHPYFLIPADGSGKRPARVEAAAVRQLLYNERRSDVRGEKAPPSGPFLVEDPEVNETLLRLGADKEVRLHLADGAIVHMKAEGVEDAELFPLLQLYAQAGHPFFCMEPWMAAPNALNDPDRPRWLGPGRSEHGRLSLWTSGPAESREAGR